MSEVAELARSLVAIDSVNPDLIPGARGEAEVAGFVADWLERAGLDVSVEEAAPNRPNVVGVARGSGGGRTLLLNAHTDTVGVDAMERPGEARLDDSRLYGRGAYDMKGALAATMVAARRARKLELRGDVVVTAVIDEEVGSLGTTALVRDVARGRRNRRRADRRAALRRPQGLRRLRGRHARAGRTRLPTGSRHRRDRADGPCPRSPSTSSTARSPSGRRIRSPGEPPCTRP